MFQPGARLLSDDDAVGLGMAYSIDDGFGIDEARGRNVVTGRPTDDPGLPGLRSGVVRRVELAAPPS